jgi:hypothetical protein
VLAREQELDRALLKGIGVITVGVAIVAILCEVFK